MGPKILGFAGLGSAVAAAYTWNTVFNGQPENALNALFWGGAALLISYLAMTAEPQTEEGFS